LFNDDDDDVLPVKAHGNSSCYCCCALLEGRTERPPAKNPQILRDVLLVLAVAVVAVLGLSRVEGTGEGGKKSTPTPADVFINDQVDDLFKDQQMKSLEFIKDRVVALKWDEMQELVAGLLRAMGYKTRISPSGSDRGKDIVASPDGLGFEDPRIVVEVKHRSATMGAPEVRSFLGGRHAHDKGLYVSTGGFTREARYEAERAAIPLTLMDLDDFVHSLLEHYEKLDVVMQRLIPLRKIYWPV
jgi:restriction system protein